MTSEYQYLAWFRQRDTPDAPTGLWRTRGDEAEYLSLVDWEWHPAVTGASLPNPLRLVEITQDQAHELLSDRQRFVRYWSYQHPNSEGFPENENRVYRRRTSPESFVDEVFGEANQWEYTPLINEFTRSGNTDRPDLIAIDRDAAEQLIQQTRGVTGATDL